MATIKPFTDLEQSKKLAEILPLESADMYFEKGIGGNYKEAFGNYADMWIAENMLGIKTIPCWSLAALLDIIPKHIKEHNVLRTDIGEKDFSIWYDEVGYGVNEELPDITMECPIDACVDMIIKLHKLNLL